MSAIRKEVIISGCRLLLGDSISILPTLAGIDSVVSDPPYGIAYTSGYATDTLWGQRRSIERDETVLARDIVAEWAGERPCLMFGTWKVERKGEGRRNGKQAR